MNEVSKYHQSKEAIAEEGLIIESSKNDPSCFRPIYDKYFGMVLNFLYQRIDDKDTAIDLTQQTFMKALTNISKYEHRGLPFSSWLFRIANNELNTLFRENAKLRTVNLSDTISNVLQQELEDENLSEWITRLKKVIRNLKESDFRIVEMRFFENRPFAEIGEILEITENNAKVKTYRIIEKMKSLLLETNR